MHVLIFLSEVLPSDEDLHSDTITGPTTGANVVVLSQPQDMVCNCMTGTFPGGHPAGREEIVYSSDLLHSNLDHEEIAHNVTQHELSVQSIPQQDLSRENTLTHPTSSDKVVIDPMMESDDENEVESGQQ